MFIKEINIQNFKCFRDNKISFDPNFNLLIGGNNSGKSTLFEAMRLWQLAIQQFYTARTRKQEENLGFYKRYSYKALEITDLSFLRIQDINDVFCVKEKPFVIEVCFSNSINSANISISFKRTSRDSLNCKLGYDISGSNKIIESDLFEMSNNLFEVMGIAKNDTFRNRIRLAYISPKFNLPNKEILLSEKNEYISENLILGNSHLVLRNILHSWSEFNYRRETKKAKIGELKNKLSNIINESDFNNQYSTIIKPYIENILMDKISSNENVKKRPLDKVEKGLHKILNQDFNFKSYLDPTKFSTLAIKNSIDNIEISQLGSGTINVLNILSVLEYNNQTIDKAATKCNILLLDEPDSHLHSNLQSELFNHLEMESKDKNTQIFIITHNSNLISQFENVLFINSSKEEIKPISLDDYLENHLKELDKAQYNVMKELSETKKEKIILNRQLDDIKNINIPLIYTEGPSDIIILENAFNILYDNIEKPFQLVNGYSCTQLKNTFENNKTFIKNSIYPQIAIFDFDNAFSQWNGLWNSKNEKKYNNIELNPFRCLTKKHNDYNAYAILLPVPKIENIKKQVLDPDKSDNNFGDKSVLQIEHLFFDVDILKDSFKIENGSGGAKFVYFIGNKDTFAQNTKNLDKENFKHFIPLFEKITEIINYKLPKVDFKS
jgi:AAA15 family ATPase/GTPase